MNTITKFKNRFWITFRNQLALPTAGLALVLAPTVLTRAEAPPSPISFSDIGAKATADYKGDALAVTATADGALLRCGFQKLEGHATPQGLWLESTDPGSQGNLRLVATVLRHGENSTANSESSITLPNTGTVTVQDKQVEFTRPGVTEEYSVSVDGVRQNFVVTERPLGKGDLCVELALNGARAEPVTYGARLKLDGSGRELAYSRLRVEDAKGQELKAFLKVLSTNCLVVTVADANATYPVRIDPTFSDADWVSLNPGLPGTTGDQFNSIDALAVDKSGNVYLGGSFTFIGTVFANHIAKWDGKAWSALGSGMNDSVAALAVSGTNLYAGGYFTTAGGVTANYIAKWDGHAWSALGSGLSGYDWYTNVAALAVSGSNLYAAGRFKTVGGMSAYNIAKWDGSSWSALGAGIDGDVYVLAASGPDLYAGGEFNQVGGVAAGGVAKWDGTNWSTLMTIDDGFIQALAVSGTKLYVGTHLFYSPGNCLFMWNGSSWSALGLGINYDVSALVVNGKDLYAGGQFFHAGGTTANFIVKWDGTNWSELGTGVDNPVYELAVSETNLYVAGIFSMAGDVAVNHVAKWDGNSWSGLGSGINDAVEAVAVNGTDLYIGGRFIKAGQTTVNHIAKWDGNKWSALGSGFTGKSGDTDVQSLAVSGTNLYAGGYFTSAGGTAATNIAKWDGQAWSPLGAGVNDEVFALAVSGSDLYAGGRFNQAGEAAASHIAKWDGNNWSVLGSGVNSEVRALAVRGTNLYAGGYFKQAGGVAANCIAKWDGSNWSALGSGITPVANNVVKALAVSGADLYVGGWFNQVGGAAANYVAKWDGQVWSTLGSGVDGPVYVLAAIAGDLYVGGSFTNAGGALANHIAKWDGRSWSGLGSGMTAPGLGHDGSVFALATDELGRLFVGGGFLLAGTNVSPFIAQANVGSVRLPPQSQTVEIGSTVDLTPDIEGYPAVTYLLLCDGTNVICWSTNGYLILSNVDISMSRNYTVVVTNAFGAVTSAPVMLNVIPAVERRPVPAINLMGTIGTSLSVEYSDTLGPAANWLPLDSVNLTNPPQFCFDASTPLPPQRFYRAWQTGTPSVIPSLDLHFVPAILLTGNIGDSLRLDYINAIGPTDAWVTLDTVTLTNASQLYFDTSSIGQPHRLYRVMPIP